MMDAFLIADFFISDVAISDKPLLEIDDPTDKVLYNKLQKIYTFAMTKYYYNDTHLKTTIFGFMTYLKVQQKKIADAYKSDLLEKDYLKYILLSAHDSTILTVFLARGIWNKYCYDLEFLDGKAVEDCYLYPPLASSLIFELVDIDTDNQNRLVKVRVNYNGNYQNWCNLSDMKNFSGKWDCEVNYFIKSIDKLLIKDFDEACSGSGAEKKEDLLANNLVMKQAKGVGVFGGLCKCPDGQVYPVGDYGNNCKSVACLGGGVMVEECHLKEGVWSFNNVICREKIGDQFKSDAIQNYLRDHVDNDI